MKKVGITTDLSRRKAEHKSEHPNLRNWEVRSRNLTRTQAQSKENEFKRKGYKAHHGGRNPENSSGWAVYTFEY